MTAARVLLRSSVLAVSVLVLQPAPADAAGQLHIYVFGDYLNPKVVELFAAKYDIQATVDTYDSNDQMLAKVKSGASGYDIAVAGNFVVPTMIRDGLVARTEPDQMSNYKNLRPEFEHVFWDDGRHYTVPFLWGTTGFSVNTDFYKGPLDSWSLIFDPPAELRGHINAVPEAQDVINSVAYYRHIPLCSAAKDDLKAIQDTLSAAKKNWQSMQYGVIDIMTSQGAYATMNWNGASLRAREQLPSVTYVYPKEGMVSWMDNVVVLSDAPNLANAKLFQNFLMDPEIAAKLTSFAHYDNGIRDTEKFLPVHLTEAPEIVVPAGFKPVFAPACSQQVMTIYGKIWNKVMK
ncbi:MAG TPA: extracellular solute-binding protein [Dongiaceae bacterium]|nr:extracellular solute-binding protein [Dongiaceae bacterium]